MFDLAQPICRSAAATNPPHDELPLDSDILLDHCMQNLDLALTLIEAFQRSGTEQVNVIVRSALAGDALAAAESAHSLKGASAIMGARKLSALACRIEAFDSRRQAEPVLELADQLRSEMDRCMTYLPQLSAELELADSSVHTLQDSPS